MTLALLTALACTTEAGDTGAEVPLNPDSVATSDDLYMVHLTPSSEPFVSGEDVTLGMHVLQDGEGVAGATVEVVPWMVDMDHGTGEVVVTEMTMGDEVGMYEAAFSFSMGGYWEVTIDIDGSQAVVAYEVD